MCACRTRDGRPTVLVIEQNVFELNLSSSDIAPRITASSTTTAEKASRENGTSLVLLRPLTQRVDSEAECEHDSMRLKYGFVDFPV